MLRCARAAAATSPPGHSSIATPQCSSVSIRSAQHALCAPHSPSQKRCTRPQRVGRGRPERVMPFNPIETASPSRWHRE
eukprot:1887116-Prymnesium_polylepis.1